MNTDNELNKNHRPQAHKIRRIGVNIVVGAAVLLAVVIVFHQVSLWREENDRKKMLAAGPRVRVVAVSPSPTEKKLTLSGEARPFESVTLYSKVSGYLKDVHADKGDHVEKDQLLAVVESAETSNDYAGAVADARNKRGMAERLKPLLDKKLISQQEADSAFADAEVAEAKVGSLGALKGYQEIRAPFSGVVTARFADPGALVQSAANSQTSALPLFTVSQTNRLRVYVYLDQKEAPLIHKDLPVVITLAERPDVQVPAKVTRFSGELDPKTRMLLAEVDVDNRDGRLVAGSYVQVALTVKAPSYLQVPVEALLEKQSKDFVPVLSSSNTISYRPVVVANNDGDNVTVLSGLKEGEMVALNVGNSLDEGSLVQPIVPQPPAPVVK